MQVRLVSQTVGSADTEFAGKSIDEIIVGIARVSSSRETNELFSEPEKLLRHCLTQGHWSIFDEANMTFEIKTSRAIARELMRHDVKRQEFSQRYAEVSEFESVELRRQAKDNRQSSSELIDVPGLNDYVETAIGTSEETYRYLLENGVAKECARFVLPEATMTTIYLNGTIRVWLSILNQRLHRTTQKECKEIAQAVRDIFIKICPIISAMVFNFEDAEECHIFERLILEKYGVYELVKENKFKKLKKNDKISKIN